MSKIKYLAIGSFTSVTNYHRDEEDENTVFNRYTYVASNQKHSSSPCLAKCGKKAFVCNCNSRVQAGLGSTFCEYYQRWVESEKHLMTQEKERVIRGLVG